VRQHLFLVLLAVIFVFNSVGAFIMADHSGAGINTVNTKPRVVSHISKLSINEVNEVNEVKESSSADSSPDSASSATAPESLLQTSSAASRLTEKGDDVQMTSAVSPEMAPPSIGLDLLQDQVRRIARRKGFTLNLMVIGRSGLGKSTLINTLFRTTALPHEIESKPTSATTTCLRTTRTVIVEDGVKLELTVTDTPGFGDHISNTNCWEPAMSYIESQYDRYLKEEQSTDRGRFISDSRIHCCLYFIAPTGHNLPALDLQVLKRLNGVVNVIPVIAKADSLTMEERDEFRSRIQTDFKKNGVQVYPSAQYEHYDDRDMNETYRNLAPFAVVGSEKLYKNEEGRHVLGRLNRWGLVQVEDPRHCEFHHLRDLLVRSRMQDLIELTSTIHYENFRRRRLQEMESLADIHTLNESRI